MILGVVVGRGSVQFYVGSRLRAYIFLIFTVLSLVDIRI